MSIKCMTLLVVDFYCRYWLLYFTDSKITNTETNILCNNLFTVIRIEKPAAKRIGHGSVEYDGTVHCCFPYILPLIGSP